MRLGSPLIALRGVGEKRAAVFGSEGIRTVGDLLFMLPYRYLDRSREAGIGSAPMGRETTVVGQVVSSRVVPGRKSRLVAELDDGTGTMSCVWFGGGRYVRNVLEVGDWVAAAGKMTGFKGKRQMTHPEIEVLTGKGDDDRLHTRGIVPLYSTTSKMKSERISTRVIRRLMRQALDALELPDFLPEPLRARNELVELMAALQSLHFPETMGDVEGARVRFAFEELLTVLLWVLKKRRDEAGEAGRAVDVPGELIDRAVEALPFTPTGAQSRALERIREDMASGRSMHRLLQGDVGSGKTLVAAMAALAVVEAGGQVVVMAPTEILAEQHAAAIRRIVKGLDVHVSLIKGGMKGSERSAALSLIAGGRIHIVVGTHALIESDVTFRDLGLAVIDEQHRFGVLQRAKLREKGHGVHLLVMTATPIPRSLALTLYGDLDVTVLDEMPPGRQSIKTGWRGPADREKALGFVREQVEAGRQAYIIYPLVETSGAGTARAATQAYDELTEGPLEGIRMGLLHGRMDGDAKADVMARFRDGEIDVLVSTTVVEVGVDVPNASVMFVEHAERFGLSQLHQLRGRVGRGPHASYCILIADPEGDLTDDARQRLAALCETNDGFEIAERDLQIRGAGELFGTRQAGLPTFRFADLARDAGLIATARREAEDMLAEDPDLAGHPVLGDRVERLAEANEVAEGAG